MTDQEEHLKNLADGLRAKCKALGKFLDHWEEKVKKGEAWPLTQAEIVILGIYAEWFSETISEPEAIKLKLLRDNLQKEPRKPGFWDTVRRCL